MAAIKPTDEQDAIISAARYESCLAVEAGAGTGKTTTLTQIAQDRHNKRGLIVVFNKNMADATKARITRGEWTARTMHSLAYGSAVAEPFRRNDRKRLNSMVPARMAASAVGLDRGVLQMGDIDLGPFDTGDILKDWVGRFCQSAEPELSFKHFPRGTLFEALDVKSMRKANEDPSWFNLVVDDVARNLIKGAKKLWELMSDPDGDFLSSDDVYLKLFAMENPPLNLDYMVLDEAQDANPVMLQIMEQARRQGSQIILVGDSHQQMYSWRGAVDAMTKINASRRLQLTQSFRFGQDVADVANAVLGRMIGTPFRIEGVGKPSRVVGSMPLPSAVISRTNASAIAGALEARSYGVRTGLRMDKTSILREIDALDDLRRLGRCNYQRFAKFQSYDELMRAVSSGDAPDIKVLIDLMQKMGVNNTKEAIAEIAVGKEQKEIDRANIETLYLTAHAAKGLEFDGVLLADDFKGKNKEGGLPPTEELKILYVAVTRAKSALCLGTSVAARDLYSTGEIPRAHLEESYKAPPRNAQARSHKQPEHGTAGHSPLRAQKAHPVEISTQPKAAETSAVKLHTKVAWSNEEEKSAWDLWHGGKTVDEISGQIGKSSVATLMRMSMMLGCSVQDVVLESLKRESGQPTRQDATPKAAAARQSQTSLF